MGDVVGGSIVGDIFGMGDAGDAAVDAAEIQADYQQQALDYLMESQEVPQQFLEGALSELGGIYGLEGGTGSQQELIDSILASPLYEALLSGQEAGEESILAQAAATGGLRSGNVQEALYDYNTQMESQALLDLYNQQISGLEGLAGLSGGSTVTDEISAMIESIGETLAAGTTGEAQADADEMSQLINTAISAAAVAAMFSDRRLKKNITKIGECKGYSMYSFTWNKLANMMGLRGKTIGVMADEVYPICPEAVSIKNDHLFVNYSKLGILPYLEV